MISPQSEIEKKIHDSYELPNNVLKAVQEPMVTVRTSTYQHVSYIKECIEGVLMQKTDFPIEFIIGEDFSTDGTREIVFEYAEKYPDIIRVLTADYNIGSIANGQRCIREARGKYMALCEGDDYWSDPLKLQKQISALEKNQNCDMSFHPAIAKYENGISKNEIICNHSNKNKIFSPEEIISGGPTFCPTVSLVIRKSAIEKGSLYEKADLSFSFFVQVFSAMRGGALYINESMAVYRKMSTGSFSEVSKKDPEMWFDHNKMFLSYLNRANSVTEYKYKNEFGVLISNRILRILKDRNIDIYDRKKVYKENKKSMKIKHRVKWIIILLKDLYTNFVNTLK